MPLLIAFVTLLLVYLYNIPFKFNKKSYKFIAFTYYNINKKLYQINDRVQCIFYQIHMYKIHYYSIEQR